MSKVYVNYITEQYFANGKVIPNDCNSITFYNAGSDSVMIMDTIALSPGDNFSFSNTSHLHVIKTTFNIRFLTLTAPKLLVIKEFKSLQ